MARLTEQEQQEIIRFIEADLLSYCMLIQQRAVA